jgi:hypothetical protein
MAPATKERITGAPLRVAHSSSWMIDLPAQVYTSPTSVTYKPVSHVVHTEAPLELEKLSVGHAVQFSAPPGAYAPWRHSVQVLIPTSGCAYPTAHVEHIVVPVEATALPAPHEVHAVDPETLLNVPTAQMSHSLWPINAWAYPPGQITHVVAPVDPTW